MTAANVEGHAAGAGPASFTCRNFYHDARDDFFKAKLLTLPPGPAVNQAAEQRLKALPDTEAARVARLFLPADPQGPVGRGCGSHAGWRRCATIEALRMHAAAHDRPVARQARSGDSRAGAERPGDRQAVRVSCAMDATAEAHQPHPRRTAGDDRPALPGDAAEVSRLKTRPGLRPTADSLPCACGGATNGDCCKSLRRTT